MGELGADFVVVGDVDLFEDGLVELAPDCGCGVEVGVLPVGCELDGLLEVGLDGVVVVGDGVEAGLGGGDLAGDALLFAFE